MNDLEFEDIEDTEDYELVLSQQEIDRLADIKRRRSEHMKRIGGKNALSKETKDNIAIKKYMYLEALVRNKFLATKAAEDVGVTTRTIDTWKKKDEVFANACDKTRARMAELAEYVLYTKLEEGNLNAAMFVLKTLDRKRYGEGYDPSLAFGKELHITVHVPQELLGGVGFEPIDPKIIDAEYQQDGE